MGHYAGRKLEGPKLQHHFPQHFSVKLGVRASDGCTVHWVRNCLDGQAQRMVGNGVTSSGVHRGSALGPILLSRLG